MQGKTVSLTTALGLYSSRHVKAGTAGNRFAKPSSIKKRKIERNWGSSSFYIKEINCLTPEGEMFGSGGGGEPPSAPPPPFWRHKTRQPHQGGRHTRATSRLTIFKSAYVSFRLVFPLPSCPLPPTYISHITCRPATWHDGWLRPCSGQNLHALTLTHRRTRIRTCTRT